MCFQMPGGVNITGRIAYTGSATAEVPVKVEFTCANCGKATHNDIPVVISGSSGGYSAQQTAGKVALFSHDGAGSRMVRCVRDHLVQTPAESHVAFVYLPGVDSRHRGGLLCGRAANRRMYDHPERLAKRGMALNKEIYADFTPCGLDRIHVGSKRWGIVIFCHFQHRCASLFSSLPSCHDFIYGNLSVFLLAPRLAS